MTGGLQLRAAAQIGERLLPADRVIHRVEILGERQLRAPFEEPPEDVASRLRIVAAECAFCDRVRDGAFEPPLI